jgi:hypothetical protein
MLLRMYRNIMDFVIRIRLSEHKPLWYGVYVIKQRNELQSTVWRCFNYFRLIYFRTSHRKLYQTCSTLLWLRLYPYIKRRQTRTYAYHTRHSRFTHKQSKWLAKVNCFKILEWSITAVYTVSLIKFILPNEKVKPNFLYMYVCSKLPCGVLITLLCFNHLAMF